MQKDKIQQLYVFRQKGPEEKSLLFLISLIGHVDYPISIVEELPKKLTKQSGSLLLGNNTRINSLSDLPRQSLYVLAHAVEQNQVFPQGVKFFDYLPYMGVSGQI
ncbi:hypothetical protein [Acinetobacter sp. SFB]|uniref:hypothetical protein n=1 Tax=Acinetobacter sp. SFB TaxID=1805634 RepID=UPI0009D6ADC4|nr:hypothetical protein [Acinetobacter sp. SFB]